MEEMRAQRLDLLARAKFAKDGEQITETRLLLAEGYEEDQAAAQLSELVGDGLAEVG